MTFPKTEGELSKVEVAEMLEYGIFYAKKIHLNYLNTKKHLPFYIVGIVQGREKGWRVHIFLLGYTVLAAKNLLQALGVRKDDAPKLRN